MPPEVTTTAWPPYSNSPTTSRLLCDTPGGPVRREHHAAHPGDRTVGAHELVDPVARPVEHPPGRDVLAHLALERRDDAGAGAPRDVEARHRVAVPAAGAVAALGPPDDGEERDAELLEPGPLLAGRPLDVRAAPPAPPVVGAGAAVGRGEAVPAGGALPVLPGELEGVGDAHPALLGAVDEEQAAEAPPRLAAEVRLALLVEQHHRPAGVGELARGDETGEAGSHDHDVGIHGPTLCPRHRQSTTLDRGSPGG